MVATASRLRAYFLPPDGRLRRGASEVVLLAAMALGVALSFSNIVQRTDWALYDRYMATASAVSPQPEGVLIVAIDEPSFQQIGLPWPWPRSLHAALLEALGAAGARRVVLDLVFDVPSNPADDGVFAEALSDALPAVLAGDLRRTVSEGYVHQQAILPWEQFLRAGVDVGMATLYFDPDNVIRRAPLTVAGYPTLALAAYLAEEQQNGAIEGALVELPSSPLIRFYGPPQLGIRTVSYYQALSPGQFLPSGLFEGQTIFVGLSLGAEATVGPSTDQHATPVAANTPGVEIQATAFANLVGSEFVRDPFGPSWALLLFSVFPAVVLAAALRRFSVWGSLLLLSGIYLSMLLGGFLLLKLGNTRIPVVQPAVVMTIVFAVGAVYRYTLGVMERRFILGAFKHYLAPVIVEQILDDPSQLKLGGSEYDATILFSDLAGFTTLSESLSPSEVTGILSDYLEEMMAVLQAKGATLDKFIGDAIMVYFGCPVVNYEHPQQACEAAYLMQQRLSDFNRRQQSRNLPPLSMRIGINTGTVVAGNMGTENIFNFTVIGDTVNLAARLEGINKYYGTRTLVSEYTARRLSDEMVVRELDRITVKGKSEAVGLYELIGFRQDMPEGTQQLLEGYSEALRLYRRRDWDGAVAKLSDLLDVFDDPPSRTLIARCQRYRAEPPADGWEGVYVFESK